MFSVHNKLFVCVGWLFVHPIFIPSCIWNEMGAFVAKHSVASVFTCKSYRIRIDFERLLYAQQRNEKSIQRFVNPITDSYSTLAEASPSNAAHRQSKRKSESMLCVFCAAVCHSSIFVGFCSWVLSLVWYMTARVREQSKTPMCSLSMMLFFICSAVARLWLPLRLFEQFGCEPLQPYTPISIS